MKNCSKCNIEKDDDQFRIGHNQCSSCIKAKNSIRSKAYYAANKEKVKAKRKAYHAANKEKVNTKCKEYNSANKDIIAAYKKDWAENNRERLTLKNKSWRKGNPLKVREMMLRGTSLRGMPEILIETQALNNLIKYTLKQGEQL